MSDPDVLARISAQSIVEGLFDQIIDMVVFIKDRDARYLAVNKGLINRSGRGDRSQIIGRTTTDIFPDPLGKRYWLQDRKVLDSGTPIRGQLELHLFPDGKQGWCLTDKTPLFDDSGAVIGLSGVSRDLHAIHETIDDLDAIARAIAVFQGQLDDPITVGDLAQRSGMSTYRFTRRIISIYGVTPKQLLSSIRLDHATCLLRTVELPIATIALRCGYSDQSAFSRAFKKASGLTPQQYRLRSITATEGR